ncbi:hypothetical protein Dda_5583 [Drechslerella dactyloides]|uniref:DUF7053 domain-containing protein n=1 Tax=Drechslerella dactyloides TaxID=74499 RepID=A0AAD6IXS2_DREDA|nr:hypothetical protein Dda_5583 [Drechslerella dactyloides]
MAMTKRNVFTTVTPLPATIGRKTVIDFFHNHEAMIDLNPLVIERHPIKAPETASADEATCVWYSLTDKVHYLPGGIASGNVSYTACFNDLPNGLQTHCRAPAGVDIRSIWTLRGSLPGEPKEPMELGITVPKEGLYIREDVDLRCNFILSSFVKKTLKKAHSVLVDRMSARAERKEMDKAIATQFPATNIVADAAGMPTAPSAPPQQPSEAVPPYGGDPRNSFTTPTTHPHPGYPTHNPHAQYAYPDPNVHYQHGPLASPDPRLSYYSNAPSSVDPRMSYQSTQSWSSQGSHSQPPGQLGPPPGYGPYPGYAYGPPVPTPYDNKTWDPQNGWYQPTMQPVEIASSEYVLPAASGNSDEKKKEDEKKVEKPKGDEKKDDTTKKDALGPAHPQPVRTHTFEMP